MNTRAKDILSIMETRERAKNAFERDMADKALGRVRSESKRVEEIRGKLLMAVRNRDNHARRRFEHELMLIEADKTYGREY